MRTDSIIKQAGFQALQEKLDIVELERFIVLLNRNKFDYTEWRKTLFEDMPVGQLAEAAERYSENLPEA